MMLTKIMFPDELQLRVDRVELEEGRMVMSVTAISEESICPYCGTASERIHSSYQRHPADISLAGYTVGLDITVPRFFCDNTQCEAKTFAERMAGLIKPYAHRTDRLAGQQRRVAFEAGGEAGARLLNELGMPVSPDTLIRLVRNASEPAMNTPRVLGIDDWAKRKGQSYGTILVDLEAHKPVDVLPDRSAELVAEWLRAHPGVEIISRDRGKEYIKGATDAIQVADRWHLLKNLRDTLKQLLEGKRACLRAAAEESGQNVSEQEQPGKSIESEEIPTVRTPKTPTKLTKAEKRKLEGRGKRQERYEAVKELHKLGLSKSEISRCMKLNWRTVSKYTTADKCPMYPERRRPSKLDPYIDYIQKRWESGCHNATQIWREIRDMGFDGARRTVAKWATEKRKSLRSSGSAATTRQVVPWSSHRASWLLVSEEDQLTEEDKQALERMKQADEKVAQAYMLGQRFVRMIREQESESLLPWLEDATNSGIDALKQFAKGITQDLDAVTNALLLPWSNGQTEGQVNRLKLIKRKMYGRANFDLLRRRVLFTPMRC